MAKTDRGFELGKFTDRYGTECSIQESSLATEAAIWLGVDDCMPQIMASEAINLGIPTGGQTTGWIPYPIPKEVLLTTRMHLTQEQVAKLLPSLEHFVKTGFLPDPDDQVADVMNKIASAGKSTKSNDND